MVNHLPTVKGSIPGSGRSPGEGNGNPLQYSCLENPMDGAAWWATVHGVAKSQTRLSDFTFTFHFHASEKEMATHSSVLAWRIPGTEEPGLQSLGSQRVGHNWASSLSFHDWINRPRLAVALQSVLWSCRENYACRLKLLPGWVVLKTYSFILGACVLGLCDPAPTFSLVAVCGLLFAGASLEAGPGSRHAGLIAVA